MLFYKKTLNIIYYLWLKSFIQIHFWRTVNRQSIVNIPNSDKTNQKAANWQVSASTSNRANKSSSSMSPGRLACEPNFFIWWLNHPTSKLDFHLASWNGKFCAPLTVAQRLGFAHTICHKDRCYNKTCGGVTAVLWHVSTCGGTQRQRERTT